MSISMYVKRKLIRNSIAVALLIFVLFAFCLYLFRNYLWISNMLVSVITGGIVGFVTIGFQYYLDQKRYYNEEFGAVEMDLNNANGSLDMMLADENYYGAIMLFTSLRDNFSNFFPKYKYINLYNRNFYSAYVGIRDAVKDLVCEIDKQGVHIEMLPEPEMGIDIDKWAGTQEEYVDEVKKIRKYSERLRECQKGISSILESVGCEPINGIPQELIR